MFNERFAQVGPIPFNKSSHIFFCAGIVFDNINHYFAEITSNCKTIFLSRLHLMCLQKGDKLVTANI